MKLGLIVCVDEEIEKNQMFGIRYMPVWAYTLASYLRDLPDVELFLYDTRLKPKYKTPPADIYLISGINQDYHSLMAYLKYLRENHSSSLAVLGGPIVSSYHMAGKLGDLQEFDHLFMGDAENSISSFVEKLIKKEALPKLFENHKKFALMDARPMDQELIKQTHMDYYGAVLEVSRGCPFLCEFCDIRTKPDNNSANNKKLETILEEISLFTALGTSNFLLACDNFIGNPAWAEEFCDKVIEYKAKSGSSPRFYTWLTINLADHPRLLEKFMMAGFDMFFIGIESFGANQLLETAKLQNVKSDLGDSIKKIQSYGFIVVAGLIFGFDTDPEDAVQITLNGIRKSGLISGDPSLLTALPGTPLYRRMQLSKRLRKGKLGLGGKKYVTNILYLRDKDRMIQDFIHFVNEFNQPAYQLARFNNFLSCLSENSQGPLKGPGYINLHSLFKLVSQHPGNLLSVIKRFWGVVDSLEKLAHVYKALRATKAHPYGKMSYFYFWLFNWSNSILKYGALSTGDFDIDSLQREVTFRDVVPEGYETDYFEPIPERKIKSQRQATVKALSKVFTSEG